MGCTVDSTYKLPKGCIIDAEDIPLLGKTSWFLANGYVEGKVGGVRVKLHRLIIGARPGQQVDHKNRNKLDNRKSNLRFCTTAQNSANREKNTFRSSKYKGVSWHKGAKKWLVDVRFRVNGKQNTQYSGYFTDEIEAALAYDKAAALFYGEFARLNFPKEPTCQD